MKLSTVLASIKEQEKTAEVQPQTPPSKPAEKTAAAGPASTAEKLKAALKEATAGASPPAEKTAAAATSPVEGLTKIANSVAAAEQDALVKEAQLYGAAVCDGFMVRLSQYNEAAEKIAAQQPAPGRAPEKTAAADSFEKFAAENPELVKQAAELGYATTIAQIEKLAEVAWQKGHDEGTATIYKLAHDCFVSGYRDTGQLLSELK
jgi:hypothetical protein